MELKENLILNEENQKIVLFDIITEKFMQLNPAASIIFKNIDKTEKEILEIFESVFINLPENIEKEIIEVKQTMKEKFFYD